MKYPVTLPAFPVPVPPMLEQALDYPGQARLVAFYWSPMGDEARYDDGGCSGDADWAAYLTFVEHPKVEPQLRRFDLGSSEGEAQQWLVLDREARTLSVLPVEEAAALLKQQWGVQPALLLRLEAPDPIPALLAVHTGRVGWRVVSVNMVPVPQPRQELASRLVEMRTWLDWQEGGVLPTDG